VRDDCEKNRVSTEQIFVAARGSKVEMISQHSSMRSENQIFIGVLDPAVSLLALYLSFKRMLTKQRFVQSIRTFTV